MNTLRNVSHVSKLKKNELRKNEKREKKVKREGEGTNGWGERKKREREREKGKKISLVSKIYENRTIGFSQSKRQTRSTHRELRVGTKILEFCQTPRGKKFSYLGYFYRKGHLMAWGFY